MTWFSLPYEDEVRKMQLKQMVGVNGIPNLTVVLAQTGEIIIEDACSYFGHHSDAQEIYNEWI